MVLIRTCARLHRGSRLRFTLVLAVYCRASMGHWPRYHEYLMAYDLPLFKLIGASFLFSGVVSVFSVGLLLGRPTIWQVAGFFAGWLLLLGLVTANPYGFTSFLID